MYVRSCWKLLNFLEITISGASSCYQVLEEQQGWFSFSPGYGCLRRQFSDQVSSSPGREEMEVCYSSLPGGDLIVPEATIYPLVLMDVPSQGSNLMDVIIHRLPNAKGSSVEGFSINLIFFFFCPQSDLSSSWSCLLVACMCLSTAAP